MTPRGPTASWTRHFAPLPDVYASLIRMDFTFTFGTQARLAADLVGDPNFGGNCVQASNMKRGLGLHKPSKGLWTLVGKLPVDTTSKYSKVNLLACIVPGFGEIWRR